MRSPLTVTLMIVFFMILFSLILIPNRNAPRVSHKPVKHKKPSSEPDPPAEEPKKTDVFNPSVSEELLTGEQIMPQLGNATAKSASFPSLFRARAIMLTVFL